MQSFLSPRNRGFKTFLLKTNIKFGSLDSELLISVLVPPILSCFHKAFSERPIFRPSLYLRPRQNKLSLNFRWGSEWVNGLFEHVFATKLAGNAPWGTKWPPYSLGVSTRYWRRIPSQRIIMVQRIQYCNRYNTRYNTILIEVARSLFEISAFLSFPIIL